VPLNHGKLFLSGEVFGPFNKKSLQINLLPTGEIFGPFNSVTKRFDCMSNLYENFCLYTCIFQFKVNTILLTSKFKRIKRIYFRSKTTHPRSIKFLYSNQKSTRPQNSNPLLPCLFSVQFHCESVDTFLLARTGHLPWSAGGRIKFGESWKPRPQMATAHFWPGHSGHFDFYERRILAERARD
jgi:hypothetical protein